MPPAGTPVRLRSLPTWLLNHLAIEATRVVGDRLGHPSLRSDYAVLATLEEGGPASQATLGRRLGKDRSDVAGILDRLERDGFVLRAPDPANRRRNAITLTPSGAQELARLHVQIEQAQDALLAPLTPGQRAELTTLLQTLTEHHRAIRRAGQA